MKNHLVRIATCIVFCLPLLAISNGGYVQQGLLEAGDDLPADKLLNKKIESYSQLYPDILFLILKGGDETIEDMIALNLILGHEPVSMDYEHPPELREDLMLVSAERILFMLKNNMPSASLFKADEPNNWQEHVCVLTISPDLLAADSVRATGYLLNMPDTLIQRIPQDFQLRAEDYLEYVIDHEVYHCLHAMYVGPQKMSLNELWGEYSQYLAEQGADSYAVAMHIKNRPKESSFPKNIQRIRGMSLYNVDPDHMTVQALDQLMNIHRDNIIKLSQQEIFELAKEIKTSQTISYEKYLNYLASAVEAMRLLGLKASSLEVLNQKLIDIQVDPEKVNELVTYSRRSLSELKGECHTHN